MAKSKITNEIQALQTDMVEAMSGEQRILTAIQMSELVHALAKEGIRHAHPAWSERRVFREFMKIAFSPEPLPAWLDEKLGPETE